MSWWRPKERPDKQAWDWRRFNDQLAPIVQAELDRGNALVPPGRWQKHYDIDGRGAVEFRLRLRYQLDTEAINAQFILPQGTATRGSSLVRGNFAYYVISGDRPADAARQEALRAWWQAWEDGPQTRIPIASQASNVIPITPRHQEPDHEK